MKHSSLFKHYFIKAVTVLLSLIFILAFAVPPAAVQAQGDDPVPSIEAFAWFDRISLINWPADIPVTVTILGTEYAGSVTPDIPEGRYDFYPGNEGVDLQPGTTISASNGEITKTLTISPLSGSVVSAATGRVKGKATPGSTFHMITMGDNFEAQIEQDVKADGKGNWIATIDKYTPWAWFTRGEMWETDADGDVTYAIWHVQQPVIEIWLQENEIRAFDWPLDTELTFSVNGKVIGTAPTQREAWFEGTSAIVNAGDLVLKPGDIVTVSDAEENVTKRTTVQDIRITYVNVDANTVSGTGPLNANLDLITSLESAFHRFNTGNNPEWTVNFNELNDGDHLSLFMRERDRDSTVWDTNARNPSIIAFPNGNEEVIANNWMAGVTLTLTVQDQLGEVVYSDTATVPPGNPPQDAWTDVRFGMQGQHDLQPGDVVTITDGITTRTHTVRNMGISSVKIYENTVAGWADPGAELQVWAHGYDQSTHWVTSDGQWSVNFDPFTLEFGMCGRAQIFDEQGNGTAQDWCLPKPWLEAFPENDAIETWEWPDGTEVYLTIDKAPGLEWSGIAETTAWGDPRTIYRFELGGMYDLEVGDMVSVTDGATTITHTVQNLGVYSVSVDNNSVSGWTDPGRQVTLWPHGFDQSATEIVDADENGFWRAWFWPEFDITAGSAGRSHVMDENGNYTAVDWGTYGTNWREDFDQGGLNPDWKWPNGDPNSNAEPADDWSLTDYGFLRLPLSHTRLQEGSLLLKGVQQGDFSFKTHIINFEPAANFQMAGLVIYGDDDNILQLGRAYCEPSDFCVGNGIYFDYLEGGDIFANPNYATPVPNLNEAYLRLDKRGDMVRGYYSEDGVTWITIGDQWLPWDFQVNGIGIAASNNLSDQEISAEFDFVELTEADGFLPEGYHDYNDGNQPISGCTAGGWATDPDDRNVDLNIRIDVDGNTMDLPITANLTRPDLINACIDGNCSFDTSLWGLITPDIYHEITVYAQDAATGEWARLYNTPKYLNCHSEG